MKLLVAGSRTICDRDLVYESIGLVADKMKITEIISGGANGVDTLAEYYAGDHKIPFTLIPPEWHVHGNKAGVIRNKLMVEMADFVLVIWDGESRGAMNTIEEARKRNKPLWVVYG
jgi:predicted Rossmann fold nucleotide-binding protein DprA/Smf involved in DNA uptake